MGSHGLGLGEFFQPSLWDLELPRFPGVKRRAILSHPYGMRISDNFHRVLITLIYLAIARQRKKSCRLISRRQLHD